jgi:glycosyltransferase involved in cell wall biosynthesis
MTSPANVHLSVIILAFNEEALIGKSVLEALDDLKADGIEDYELVLVDDGSTDGTGTEMERLAKQYSRIRVLHHERNRGMGAGVRTGLEAAVGEYLMWLPGDAQFRLAPLLEAMPLMAECDFVIGLRPAARKRQVIRGFISWCLHSFTRFLFSVDATDYCGLFIMRRRDLPRLIGKSDDVFFTTELLVNAGRAKMRMKSTYTPVMPRTAGHSKVANLHTVFRNTRDMFRYRFRR